MSGYKPMKKVTMIQTSDGKTFALNKRKEAERHDASLRSRSKFVLFEEKVREVFNLESLFGSYPSDEEIERVEGIEDDFMDVLANNVSNLSEGVETIDDFAYTLLDLFSIYKPQMKILLSFIDEIEK